MTELENEILQELFQIFSEQCTKSIEEFIKGNNFLRVHKQEFLNPITGNVLRISRYVFDFVLISSKVGWH